MASSVLGPNLRFVAGRRQKIARALQELVQKLIELLQQFRLVVRHDCHPFDQSAEHLHGVLLQLIAQA